MRRAPHGRRTDALRNGVAKRRELRGQLTCVAARSSSRCATEEVPGMGNMTGDLASGRASTCETLTPCARAHQTPIGGSCRTLTYQLCRRISDQRGKLRTSAHPSRS